jgi:hypothetical protein
MFVIEKWIENGTIYKPQGNFVTSEVTFLTTKQNIRDVYYAQVMSLHGARATYSVF